MNRIVLEQDKVKSYDLDSSIRYEQEFDNMLGVELLKIFIDSDSKLELFYNFDDKSKIETQIYVGEGVTSNIFEKLNGSECKIRTKYFLKENSSLKVSKFNDVDRVNEYVIVNLDGMGSRFDYFLKTIAVDVEDYDILTYHNCSNSISNINTNGVCINDGLIKFNVSSFIPKGIKGCDASQNNKIINLTDNLCVIKPNLYIDEYDVVAEHAAWIGGFDRNELFYLMSRGICQSDALKLLINGFLTSGLDIDDNEYSLITKKINEYWG